jgi:formate hydrogenlyase subunit 3/multisubunit Na+/H+ antiporter MnhD subunit
MDEPLLTLLPIAVVLIFGGILILRADVKYKAFIAYAMVLMLAIGTSFLAIRALAGHPFEVLIKNTLVFGDIPLRIDALSGWFILIINFTMLTGGFYGIGYMKAYREQKTNLSLHWILLVIFYLSMLSVCLIQNGLMFLIVWEIMSLSSMLLVIFEHYKPETLRAGLNYLVQMHLSVVLLTLGVAGLYWQTHSFDFSSAMQLDAAAAIPLFILFFLGFAFKAGFMLGFIPLHTWLPQAHPAAPSHISGIMSGVMIKIGIFGILRMILLFPLNQTGYLEIIGWILLGVSLASGLYGVMLAIIQHNLKKLLAYHSIENIGIIGMGIGLGCIGLGISNPYLSAAGFASALLHTLNHSLFKSSLFFAAGNIYHTAHTLNLESLGGLFRKIPQTALLFLLSALAICGLPPFNGFISEFILYSGLYQGSLHANPVGALLLMLSILGLALIGGLALLCFTKAFGIVFLGNARKPLPQSDWKEGAGNLIPLYINSGMILAIGLFPAAFTKCLSAPLALFIPNFDLSFFNNELLANLQQVSQAAVGLIAVSLVVLGIRHLVTRRAAKAVLPTWGCGYTGGSEKMQYTATSFVRMYRKLAAPVLLVHRKNVEIPETFPHEDRTYETHPEDALEVNLIHKPINLMQRFLSFFRFIQNGKIQYYLLYGLVFLLLIGLLSWSKMI